MTEKEAIEALKEEWRRFGKAIPCDTSYGTIVNEAYKMAIAALEKMTPKRPNEMIEFQNSNCDGTIHFPDWGGKCPSCGHVLYRGVAVRKGCPYCLQAINWSENPKE